MSDNSYIDTSYGTSIDALRGDALRERIAQAVNDVREQTPLAQSFTNFVTINLVANAQLAAGGTAAMSFLPDDIIDTAEIAGSNYINMGTLLPFYKEALPQIAYELHKNGKTWVLDPVAAGIGKTRTAILESFRMYPPTPLLPAPVRQAWRPSTRWTPRSRPPSAWRVTWRSTRLQARVPSPYPAPSIW